MHKSPGGGTGSCEEERVECFFAWSAVLRDHNLLAQVGTPLPPRIDNDDRQQCSH